MKRRARPTPYKSGDLAIAKRFLPMLKKLIDNGFPKMVRK